MENNAGVILTNTSRKVLEGDFKFLSVIYIFIFIVGLPTNSMAIWVFLIRMKKKHPASILLANLALADLLFIIWLPLKIHYHFNGNNWIFGEPLCKVLVGFFYGNMYCSTVFIACISVQRYWAVVHPLSHKLTNQVAVCLSVCVWIVVWLLTIPLYLYKQTVQIKSLEKVTCHDIIRPSGLNLSIGYFLTMGIVGYVVPCVVCTVSYILMFHSLRRPMADSSGSNSKKKATILTVIVLVMFLVCFTPANIILMVYYSRLVFRHQDRLLRVYIIMLSLSSLNSSIDPFMYYFISTEFQEHVKNMLICRSERTARRMKVTSRPVKVSRETSSSKSSA